MIGSIDNVATKTTINRNVSHEANNDQAPAKTVLHVNFGKRTYRNSARLVAVCVAANCSTQLSITRNYARNAVVRCTVVASAPGLIPGLDLSVVSQFLSVSVQRTVKMIALISSYSAQSSGRLAQSDHRMPRQPLTICLSDWYSSSFNSSQLSLLPLTCELLGTFSIELWIL